VLDGNAGQQPGGTPPLDPAGTVINNLLQSFQNIDVQVPVPDVSALPGQEWTSPNATFTQAHASVPYWNNRFIKKVDGEKFDPPPGFDASARTATRGVLGIGENDAVAVGKGSPGEIGDAVTRAIAAGLLARPAYVPIADEGHWATAWRPIIESWLVKVGFGLDCSGFVYGALNEVRRETGAKTSQEANPDDMGILDYYPDEASGRTLASDEAMGGQTAAELGAKVTAPDGLEVGVVMYVPSHIRIIMSVDRTTPGITAFVTAESTIDGRYATGAANNGPRAHDWRYREGALEHRYEGSTEWVPSLEPKPVYRRHLASTLPPAPTASGGPGKNLQLKADPSRSVQRKADAAAAPGPAAAVAGSGPDSPLPQATRRQMERSFGADFTGVRVHQGDDAPAVGAQAFADGEHVHFAPGRYAPGTPAGDALLGHELAHVVQQRSGRVAAPQGKGTNVVDDPALEAEADRLGDAAAAGGASAEGAAHTAAPAQAIATSGRTVQRQTEPDGAAAEVAPAAGGFDALLASVDGILTQRAAGAPPPVTELHGPVSLLVEWCRTHLPDQAQVHSYLGSPATRDDKLRTLGRLGSELARMEFMLGGLFNGVPSGMSWRDDDSSANLFPETYLKAAGGLPAGGDWCTSFAAYGFGRLGADNSVTQFFGSGPKQREHGAIVFPQDSLSVLRQLIAFWQAAPSRHAAITSVPDLVYQFLDSGPDVLDQLDPPTTDGSRTPFEQHLYNAGADRLVAAMKNRDVPTTTPRIGDLLILNPRGPAQGGDDDHTAMIDRFAFPVLSTVEGNISNGTATRQLDLTNLEQLNQIYFITRPAQQIVDVAPAAIGGDPGAGIAQLLRLRSHNERMHAAFSKLSATGNTAPYGAPVHDWGR
jgi:hypothetical protein